MLKSALHVVLIGCLLAAIAQASMASDMSVNGADPPPAPAEKPVQRASDLAGNWKLDRDLTTADMRRNRVDHLSVEQSKTEVHFCYFDRHNDSVGSEAFITDGLEHPRYTTRIERAYAKARWRDGKLLIDTRSFLDAQGYQSYEAAERWELSDDGKTLVNRYRDSTAIVYQKESTTEMPHCAVKAQN